MANWYLTPALTKYRDEVNKRYPKRDKATDGTIGDPAHAARVSQHNPDKDGSVDAWDMDKDLNGAQSDEREIEFLKLHFQRHDAAHLWIHNRQIALRSNGWKRETYRGTNPHTGHVHWESQQATENSTKPWIIIAPPKPPTVPGPNPVNLPKWTLGARVLKLNTPQFKGTDVLFVQEFIGSWEDTKGNEIPVIKDGVFGPNTNNAVRWYQNMRGIEVDGIVGPETWAHMGIRR